MACQCIGGVDLSHAGIQHGRGEIIETAACFRFEGENYQHVEWGKLDHLLLRNQVRGSVATCCTRGVVSGFSRIAGPGQPGVTCLHVLDAPKCHF